MRHNTRCQSMINTEIVKNELKYDTLNVLNRIYFFQTQKMADTIMKPFKKR